MKFQRRIRILLIFLLFGATHRLQAQSFCSTTDDDVLIASAIGVAAGSGGGTVQLSARVYDICEAVTLQNNIHIAGAGRGATILRTRREGALSASASIIGAAVSNASVTDLTLDQRTNGRILNGIAFIDNPTTGGVSSNILIARNEVLGTPGDNHQYLVWNYRGQHVKILNNWIGSGFYGGTWIGHEEGVESFGGYDVLVQGNTVVGINGGCLNVGSPDGSPDPHSEVAGVIVSNNYVSYCFGGINVGTGSNPPQATAHVVIRDNVIVYAANDGILVTAGDGSLIRDLNISGNTVRNVGSSAGRPLENVAGVRLVVRSGRATVLGTSISGNHIDNVDGSPGVGIRLDYYQRARIRDNIVIGTSDAGVALWGDKFTASCDDIDISDNRIEAAGTYGIFAATFNRRPIITQNTIIDWGVTDGIHLEGAAYGLVRDNIFVRTDRTRPSPIYIGNASCGVVVAGNAPLYTGTVSNIAPPPCE